METRNCSDKKSVKKRIKLIMDVPCHNCGKLYYCDNHKYQGLCKNCTKIEIFKLYSLQTPIYKIARHVNMRADLVSKTISGTITFPRSIAKDIASLGFKICTNCGIRIIPIETVNYITLTILCRICWREETVIEHHIERLT